MRNGDIARRLSIQIKTAEGSCGVWFDRHGVSNRTGLVRVAVREGWIDAPGEGGQQISAE